MALARLAIILSMSPMSPDLADLAEDPTRAATPDAGTALAAGVTAANAGAGGRDYPEKSIARLAERTRWRAA